MAQTDNIDMDNSYFDTLIIGAGAAGIAAARKLHDAGHKVAILEARDRIGGRIYTDFDFAAAPPTAGGGGTCLFPIELGAEFIHGETTVVQQLVTDAAGFLHTIATPRYETLRWRSSKVAAAGGDVEGGILLLPVNRLPEPLRTTLVNLENAHNSLHKFHLPPSSTDLSLADYLRQHHYGFNEDAIRLAEVHLAQTCCASIETLSCVDLQREMQMDHAGEEKKEFKIREGYLPLLQWYSRDLDIRLNTRVHTIRWQSGTATTNNRVQVFADDHQVGDSLASTLMIPHSASTHYCTQQQDNTLPATTTAHSQLLFSARHCIVTLPVGVLQSRQIDFDPPLSAAKQAAIQSLRMEPATKLLYRFDRQLWDDDLLYFCHTGLVARWWIPGFGHGTDTESTVACAFATADRARQLDALSEADALALGLDELGQLLGRSDLAHHLVTAKRHSWASDPMTLGPPGYFESRGVVLCLCAAYNMWNSHKQGIGFL
jgi:monoamine oxidase